MALGEYENAIENTLTPPGTQYGARQGKAETGKRLIYKSLGSLSNPLQRIKYHS